MAKLISITKVHESEKRFFIVSFVARTIRVLDSQSGLEYVIQAGSITEASELMNFTDQEWASWLEDKTLGSEG